jgi:hypothetical protein
MRNTIITLCLLSILSITKVYSNSNNIIIDPYVIVRVIECQGGDTANESMILIDRGINEIEKIELEKFHKNNFESNFKIISKTLNNLKAAGYKLIATSSGGGNDNAMILQNYIFEKQIN